MLQFVDTENFAMFAHCLLVSVTVLIPSFS